MSVEDYQTGDLLSHEDWSEALRDGVLTGQRCQDCGAATAAPKAACVDCGSRSIESVELPTEGEVYSETTINVPPEGFEGSYQIVVVDLGDARVAGRVHEPGVEIGDTVELAESMETERGVGPVFEPA